MQPTAFALIASNGEARKIKQEKKLALLHNKKIKGEIAIKMDKTQASIEKLQSLIMFARQAVTTTSQAIIQQTVPTTSIII